MKCAILFLMLFLLVIGSGIQSQEQTIQPERHEVTVHLILVDVVALDKEGRFVMDLGKDDFILYEKGKPVPCHLILLMPQAEKGDFF